MNRYIGKAPKRDMTKKYIEWVIRYSLNAGGVTTKEIAEEIYQVYLESEARKYVVRMTPETTSEAKGYLRSFWDRLKL